MFGYVCNNNGLASAVASCPRVGVARGLESRFRYSQVGTGSGQVRCLHCHGCPYSMTAGLGHRLGTESGDVYAELISAAEALAQETQSIWHGNRCCTSDGDGRS